MPLPMYQPNATATPGLGQVKKVIAVGAGKGGVGKSTLSLEIAINLQKQGFSVALLDADLYGPSMARMVKLTKEPKKQEGALLPGEGCGIKLMTMGFFLGDEASVVARAPIVMKTLLQLLRSVVWGACDYLILDLPPGTGDIPLTLGQELTLAGAVLVTTPQDVAGDDVIKAAQLFTKLHVPILGLVENMSYFSLPNGQKAHPLGKGGGERLAEELEVPLLAQLPLDERISLGGDSGQPFSSSFPNDPAAEQLHALAQGIHRLVEEVEKKEASHLRNFSLKWREMSCPQPVQ